MSAGSPSIGAKVGSPCGELRTLKPGDTFYENPKDTHPVGRNVSRTEPAKLLVFFVTDRNVPLVLPPQR